jgi:hypothetical protein
MVDQIPDLIDIEPTRVSLVISSQGDMINVESNNRIILDEVWKLIKANHKRLPTQIRSVIMYTRFYSIDIQFGINDVKFTSESLKLFASCLIDSGLFSVDEDSFSLTKIVLIAHYPLRAWSRLPWYKRYFKPLKQKLLSGK